MEISSLQIFVLLFGLIALFDILQNIRLLKQKEYLLSAMLAYLFMFGFLYFLFFQPEKKGILFTVFILGILPNIYYWWKRFFRNRENKLADIFNNEKGKLTGFGLFILLMLLLILKIIFKAS
jgi:hypothetical protein